MALPDPSTLLKNLYPGLRFRDGGPDTKQMPSTYAQTIGEQLPSTWAEVAELSVGDLLEMPGVGVGKVEAFLADIQPSNESDAPEGDVVEQARPAMNVLVRWAVERDVRSLADALIEGFEKDAQIRAAFSRIELPQIRPSDWLDKAQEVLDKFDDRESLIIDKRILVVTRRPSSTLQQVADLHHVSRERIRQLEVKLSDRLVEEIDEVGRLVFGHASRTLEALGSAFPSIAMPITHMTLPERLVLWHAGPYIVSDGWVVRSPYDSVQALASAALDAAGEGGVIRPDEFFDAIGSLGIDSRFVDGVAASLPFERSGMFLIRPARTGGDRAVQRLNAVGRPMALDELYEGEPQGKNRMSFASSVQSSEEIVRSGKDMYALKEWGAEEYPGIVPAMVDRLMSSETPVKVSSLAAELQDRYGVSGNSVVMYAGMHPLFVSESGAVRLRTDDEPYTPDVSLEDTASCYLVDGCWTLRISVDSDVVRGSGRSIPEAFAVHLGAQPLKTGSLEGPDRRVSVGWSMSPTIGSVRPEVERLGLELGDWIFVRRATPAKLDFFGLRGAELERAPTEDQVKMMVGSGSPDTRDWRLVVGESVGIGSATTPTRETIRARLEQRGDDRLLAMIAKIDP